MLACKSPISVNLRLERTVTDLAQSLVHALMSHVVSIQHPQDVSRDRRWGDIEVVDSSGVNLAMVSGPIERQTPFYKGVWGVKMSADVTRWCFTAVFVADAEGDEGRASVMLEACRCRR
jgi:hypothetical protein